MIFLQIFCIFFGFYPLKTKKRKMPEENIPKIRHFAIDFTNDHNMLWLTKKVKGTHAEEKPSKNTVKNPLLGNRTNQVSASTR